MTRTYILNSIAGVFLGLATWMAVSEAREIQLHLQEVAEEHLAEIGADVSKVRVDGRDLTVTWNALDPETSARMHATLESKGGYRVITDETVTNLAQPLLDAPFDNARVDRK